MRQRAVQSAGQSTNPSSRTAPEPELMGERHPSPQTDNLEYFDQIAADKRLNSWLKEGPVQELRFTVGQGFTVTIKPVAEGAERQINPRRAGDETGPLNEIKVAYGRDDHELYRGVKGPQSPSTSRPATLEQLAGMYPPEAIKEAFEGALEQMGKQIRQEIIDLLGERTGQMRR